MACNLPDVPLVTRQECTMFSADMPADARTPLKNVGRHVYMQHVAANIDFLLYVTGHPRAPLLLIQGICPEIGLVYWEAPLEVHHSA